MLIYSLIRFIAYCHKVKQNYSDKSSKAILVQFILFTVALFSVSVTSSSMSVSSIERSLKVFPSPKCDVKFLAVFHDDGFPIIAFAFNGRYMFQADNGIAAYPFETPRRQLFFEIRKRIGAVGFGSVHHRQSTHIAITFDIKQIRYLDLPDCLSAFDDNSKCIFSFHD